MKKKKMSEETVKNKQAETEQKETEAMLHQTKSELVEELEKGLLKKKKSRKGQIIAVIIILVLVTGGFLFWQKIQTDGQTEVVISAGEGEELLHLTVSSIVGNELTGTKTPESGGSVTLQIPVGTPVMTRLGVETTFSRISAGNNLTVLVEAGTDNILKIWITQ